MLNFTLEDVCPSKIINELGLVSVCVLFLKSCVLSNCQFKDKNTNSWTFKNVCLHSLYFFVCIWENTFYGLVLLEMSVVGNFTPDFEKVPFFTSRVRLAF